MAKIFDEIGWLLEGAVFKSYDHRDGGRGGRLPPAYLHPTLQFRPPSREIDLSAVQTASFGMYEQRNKKMDYVGLRRGVILDPQICLSREHYATPPTPRHPIVGSLLTDEFHLRQSIATPK